MKSTVRLISFITVLLLVLTCFAACGKDKKSETAKADENSFVGGYDTPEKTAEQGVLCIQKADIAGLMDMLPDLLIPPLASLLGLEEGATRDDISKAISTLDTVGDTEGIEYAVTAVSTEYVKSSDEDNVKENICSAFGIEKSELKVVSQFALVNVKIKATLGEESHESDQTVTVAKIGERWYFITN